MGHAGVVTTERKPVDLALDLFFYAPVGASIEFWKRVPELSRIGRERLAAQAPAARMVGRLAVGVGRSKLGSRLGDAANLGREAVKSRDPQDAAGESRAAANDLPIPDYDDLTAIVIVPMLADLNAQERVVVRLHETAMRGRRTVLAKIDRLDAADSTKS